VANATKSIKIFLYSYPVDLESIKKVDKYLKELPGKLAAEDKNIKLQLEQRHGDSECSKLSRLHTNIIDLFGRKVGEDEMNLLVDLHDIIKNPIKYQEGNINNTIRNSGSHKLKAIFSQAFKESNELKSFVGASFIEAKRIKLDFGNHLLGINRGRYPFGISIETTSSVELIYHEFLHLLGVGEGYDPEKLTTNCENDCWMQYDPRNGNGKRLCQKHRSELLGFLNKLK